MLSTYIREIIYLMDNEPKKWVLISEGVLKYRCYEVSNFGNGVWMSISRAHVFGKRVRMNKWDKRALERAYNRWNNNATLEMLEKGVEEAYKM